MRRSIGWTFEDNMVDGLTKLPVYIPLTLNYFQNKAIFSDNAKITGRGDCTKKIEDCWSGLYLAALVC